MGTSKYDPSLDEVLDSRRIQPEGAKTWIRVEKVRYNGGVAKVAVNRFIGRKDGSEQWTKLGRMLPEEAFEVGKAIVELAAV
jgi:hypothetical protein